MPHEVYGSYCLYSHQYLLSSVIFYFSYFVGIKWYLIVVFLKKFLKFLKNNLKERESTGSGEGQREEQAPR